MFKSSLFIYFYEENTFPGENVNIFWSLWKAEDGVGAHDGVQH